ncbi:hypothetical protein C8F04DRAFT_1227363 [Mycena alexandri]|uniref:Uncharacterized protein n=1 Tax=Mycena alexandri TaxID=1745969 RepID=A0AAD6TH48_9AGAR|nr:hypothetical protein C8F04DRAFT_1227363 [Mycena alexandri]
MASKNVFGCLHFTIPPKGGPNMMFFGFQTKWSNNIYYLRTWVGYKTKTKKQACLEPMFQSQKWIDAYGQSAHLQLFPKSLSENVTEEAYSNVLERKHCPKVRAPGTLLSSDVHGRDARDEGWRQALLADTGIQPGSTTSSTSPTFDGTGNLPVQLASYNDFGCVNCAITMMFTLLSLSHLSPPTHRILDNIPATVWSVVGGVFGLEKVENITIYTLKTFRFEPVREKPNIARTPNLD